MNLLNRRSKLWCGKTILITGGTSPMVLALATRLLKRGAKVTLTVRTRKSRRVCIESLQKSCPKIENLNVIEMELADFSSIESAVKQIKQLHKEIHCLVFHAGLKRQSTPWNKIYHPRTREGFEKQFAVNFLGHVALFDLLKNLLPPTPLTKILFTGSMAMEKIEDFRNNAFFYCDGGKKTRLENSYSYSFSNLCRMMYMKKLSQQEPYTICGIFPGPVISAISGVLTEKQKNSDNYINADDAAANYEKLICEGSPSESGKIFFLGSEYIPRSSLFHDEALTDRVFHVSNRFIGSNLNKETNVFGPFKLKNKYTREEIDEFILSARSDRSRDTGHPMRDLHLYKNEIFEMCTCDSILREVSKKLGDKFSFFRSFFIIHKDGDEGTKARYDWHSDSFPSILGENGRQLSVWIGLTDVERGNGFEWVVGSSSKYKNGSISLSTDSLGNEVWSVPKRIEEKSTAFSVMKQSEFILFDDSVIHRSLPNVTNKTRYSLVLRFSTPIFRY